MKRIKDLTFKFFEKFKYFAPVSLAIILAGFIVMIFAGMNIGIDFAGGATVNVEFGDYVATRENVKEDLVDQINDLIKSEGFEIGSTRWSGEDKNIYEIGLKYSLNGKKIDASSEKAQNEFRALLEEENGLNDKIVELINNYNDEFDVIKDDTIDSNIVGAETSRKLLKNAIIATLVAIVIMLIYIGFRFTITSGLAAIVALAHDVLMMIALVTIFRVQVNTTFIAAVITIVGYSINATIVIFDRIREVAKLDSMKDATDAEIANKSIIDTLKRTILTTITTLAVIVVLAIVCAVLGVSTMAEFALPIIFGLIAGTYSSVFLSAPMWVYFRKIAKKIKNLKKTV
ncbi:MAG: protein translocase subunit SecF [Clostridiales bacterium]|nr:protein translocase subunit SecF [Clostridiales bacterium]